jgi:hypothetical protein
MASFATGGPLSSITAGTREKNGEEEAFDVVDGEDCLSFLIHEIKV